uniref:Uncharacterized protein n=1 Tax=Rhizophora mucronata TaxID=61149 RepID=A0A2P2P2T9_RHIMU
MSKFYQNNGSLLLVRHLKQHQVLFPNLRQTHFISYYLKLKTPVTWSILLTHLSNETIPVWPF